MRHNKYVLAAFVLAIAVAGLNGQATLARLSDQDDSSATFATDTLAPPTSVAATGGLLATLTWIPSIDLYASGYEILRSTSSGGPYSLVGSVTPGTASTAIDSPGAGLFYYVLRSSFQNWRSVNSNETSATITLGPIGTGLKACGTSAADTGGDGNGYETATANACADDGALATDASSGTAARSTTCSNAANDRHRFRDFGLGLPGSVTLVNGIEVRVDAGMNNNGGTSRICAELSWNGGTSWTAAKFVTLSSSAETTYVLGGAADTWGRIWTVGELTNANFRVRLIDATNHPTKDYLLDHVAVEVTYTP